VYGIQSSSTSTTSATFSSSSAVRACTINVTASGTGAVRGIMVDGPNRFIIRDTIVYVTGAATNLRGVETTSAVNQGSYAELKTSTIYGMSTVGATGSDIQRTQGTIVLNATDLVNANANSQGFSVKTEPSNIFYGVVGNVGNGTHYLLPGNNGLFFFVFNGMRSTFLTENYCVRSYFYCSQCFSWGRNCYF